MPGHRGTGHASWPQFIAWPGRCSATTSSAVRSASAGDRCGRPPRWPVGGPAPVLDDLGQVARWLDVSDAHLDWFADRRGLNRHARDERLRHYRYRWRPARLIEAPKPRLRSLQRRVLDDLLGPVPVHPDVHGFVPGRGPHTFAAVARGQRTVIRVDLTSFFASVGAPRVYGILRTAGHPEPVAHTLAALCTTRTPVGCPAVSTLHNGRIGPTGWPCCGRRTCRRALRPRRPWPTCAPTGSTGGWPGWPAPSGPPTAVTPTTSPSPVTCARAGPRLWSAGSRRSSPTRASGCTRPRRASAGRADRQILAGLVVNVAPAVSRPEYDRLRAVLHDAARNGLDAANRDGRPDFAGYLTGRVAWVGHRHPARAAKLEAMLRAATAELPALASPRPGTPWPAAWAPGTATPRPPARRGRPRRCGRVGRGRPGNR